MKKLNLLFLFSAMILFSLSSCGDDLAQKAGSSMTGTINLEETRGAQKFSIAGDAVSIPAEDMIILKAKDKQNEEAVTGIMRSLAKAENEAQKLDVKMTMAEGPVNDIFAFSLESTTEENLTFEMYDEEGFELAANNSIEVTEGKNYKAIKVSSLKEGTYYFKLKNQAGAELNQMFSIERE